ENTDRRDSFRNLQVFFKVLTIAWKPDLGGCTAYRVPRTAVLQFWRTAYRIPRTAILARCTAYRVPRTADLGWSTAYRVPRTAILPRYRLSFKYKILFCQIFENFF